jgi:hypothetical protein
MAANQPVVRGFTLERVADHRYRISLNGQPPYITEAVLSKKRIKAGQAAARW